MPFGLCSLPFSDRMNRIFRIVFYRQDAKDAKVFLGLVHFHFLFKKWKYPIASFLATKTPRHEGFETTFRQDLQDLLDCFFVLSFSISGRNWKYKIAYGKVLASRGWFLMGVMDASLKPETWNLRPDHRLMLFQYSISTSQYSIDSPYAPCPMLFALLRQDLQDLLDLFLCCHFQFPDEIENIKLPTAKF